MSPEPSQPQKILLVESNPTYQKFVQDTVADHCEDSYDVIVVGNIQEALQKIRELAEDVACGNVNSAFVADRLYPQSGDDLTEGKGMKVVETMREVLGYFADTRVAVLTTNDNRVLSDCRALGVERPRATFCPSEIMPIVKFIEGEEEAKEEIRFL